MEVKFANGSVVKVGDKFTWPRMGDPEDVRTVVKITGNTLHYTHSRSYEPSFVDSSVIDSGMIPLTPAVAQSFSSVIVEEVQSFTAYHDKSGKLVINFVKKSA